MARWFRRPAPVEPLPPPAVPEAVTAVGVEHRLAWRSNPQPGFHKAEYVPAGQDVARFGSMVLLDVLDGGGPPGAAAVAQAHAMNDVDVTGADLPHAIQHGPTDGEIVLDFIVQARDADGGYIAEFAVYRYVPHPRGLVLFGYAERAYDDDVVPWLRGLAERRPSVVAAHTGASLPVLS